MYKPGNTLYKALKGEPISHREKLVAMGEGLAGIVSSMFLGSDLLSTKEVSAAERISIEEYYNKAKATDHIIPGARIGQYKVPITGLHHSFLNGKWNEYYFDKTSDEGNEIKKILKNDENINFNLLDSYLQNNKDTFKNVVIHNEGYLRFDTYSKQFKLIIPITKDTSKKLSKVNGIK